MDDFASHARLPRYLHIDRLVSPWLRFQASFPGNKVPFIIYSNPLSIVYIHAGVRVVLFLGYTRRREGGSFESRTFFSPGKSVHVYCPQDNVHYKLRPACRDLQPILQGTKQSGTPEESLKAKLIVKPRSPTYPFSSWGPPSEVHFALLKRSEAACHCRIYTYTSRCQCWSSPYQFRLGGGGRFKVGEGISILRKGDLSNFAMFCF